MLSYYIRYGNSQAVSLTGSVTILSCRPSRPRFRLVNADSTIRAGRVELVQKDNTVMYNNRQQIVTVDRTFLG